MDIHTHVPLKNFTTMKLGGPARFFVDIHTEDELRQAYKNAQAKNIPIYVLGGGSNLIVRDEGYNGLILHIKIPGFTTVGEDDGSVTFTIGAGEWWDDVVRRTVELNLSGIEAMSGIPGTTGATPVQNVGAYGQEIADTLVSLRAYDTTTDAFVSLASTDCQFSYRDSIFRNSEAGRYIITSVTLKLSRNAPAPPFYESLQTYLDAHEISLYTPSTIRDAVLAIRAEKLPPVDEKASAGSFFKNALVEDWRFNDLKKQFPDMPGFDMGNGMFKVPSGWLIDKTGLKGKITHGIRVYEKNALVLVNESAASYQDLAEARDEIAGTVRDMFQILIEQEPLELS